MKLCYRTQGTTTYTKAWKEFKSRGEATSWVVQQYVNAGLAVMSTTADAVPKGMIYITVNLVSK